MKNMKNLSSLVLFAGLLLSGCAAPTAEEMAAIPTVTYGQPAPAGKNFVLHYPAGTPLPVVAAVDGPLFEKTDRQDLHVTLKQDIYLYRQWVSFDGRTWTDGRDSIDSLFEIRLPGREDGTSPGSLHARFALKDRK